jgi:hypothetical protein
MPHEPLALPNLLAGLPDEADYETVCAAMMATERGRRFLAEFTARNRSADTNTLVGAIARVEAAVRGEPSVQSSADLYEIAAAIGQIDAVLAASMASDTRSAVEQIQDIAFVLHERPVEQSLCDALDGAIREITDALVRPEGAAESVRKAAELLHALAARVRVMIAPSREPAEAPVAVVADHESFAEAIAALATSLPSLADAVMPEAVAASEPRADSESGGEPQSIEEEPGYVAIETSVSPAGRAGYPEAPQSTPPSSENVLLRVFESNPFSRDQSPNEFWSAPGQPNDEEPLRKSRSLGEVSDGPPSNEMLPAQNLPSELQAFSPEVMVSPEEDPGDLFELIPVPAPLPAAAVAAVELPPSTPAQRLPATPISHTIPRPPASDPLAAVRALSAEELIALFS